MTTNTRIGFIGTRAMGTEMVLKLIGAGHTVIVTNRTRRNASRAEEAGAIWVDHPRDVAEQADIVLSCLLDSAAVEQVYLGHDGLITAARTDQLFIEHGTFLLFIADRVHARFAEIGADFVDMPVTGGPAGIRSGTLVAMAGGKERAVDRVAQIAEPYCSSITRIGGPGTGLQLKLVNQLLVSIHMAAAGEAISLLQRQGIDLEVGGAVLERGWAASAMLTRALDQLRSGDVSGTGVQVGGMLEIQRLVAQLAGDEAFPVFQGSREVFEMAVSQGLAGADPAALHLAVARDLPKEEQ